MDGNQYLSKGKYPPNQWESMILLEMSGNLPKTLRPLTHLEASVNYEKEKSETNQRPKGPKREQKSTRGGSRGECLEKHAMRYGLYFRGKVLLIPVFNNK